jgi:DNA-binding SARP family transcriptional activator
VVAHDSPGRTGTRRGSSGDEKPPGEPTLQAYLLGALQLRLDGAPLPRLESARAESLLAYLLTHHEAPHTREQLAFLLWPDSTEEQARTNLRHVLHNLRRALLSLERHLEVTPRTLRWRPTAPVWLDVTAFEAELADGSLPALRSALELYRGDLLEGSYDDWLRTERERLRQRYLDALERVVAELETAGEQREAIRFAERLLREDPLREDSYRLLMRLHGARGDRARAVRVFHACVSMLDRELNVEPSPLTRLAYEALLPAPTPLPAAADLTAGTPLVGRASEWARMTAVWREVERHGARLLMISGEPGIGKTRLAEELSRWCAHRGVASAQARSYASEGELAYGPIVGWLRSASLVGSLAQLDSATRAEVARLVPELDPSVAHERRDAPSAPDARQRLFDALARSILGDRRRLLLVADDLQWADLETLQFLHYLVRFDRRAPLLVVGTVRREEVEPGHALHQLTAGLLVSDQFVEIEPGRLTQPELASLAEHWLGRPLSRSASGDLEAGTEGNPLFAIETLRAGWRGDSPPAQLPTPRVQAVIESRLSRLSPPTRELVGVAATIGREFSTDTLASATGLRDQALAQALDELWRRGIIREQGSDAYDFSHDRIRDVAYRALAPAARRRAHLLVADAIERLHGRDPDAFSAQLASHLELGGRTVDAIGWYERAAEMARRMPANAEAVRLLERASSLVDAMPPSDERAARKLAILSALQVPLAAVEGYGSERLMEFQARALELAQGLGREPEASLRLAAAVASLSRGDIAGARRIGNELAGGAGAGSEDVPAVLGGYVLGIAAFWSGEFQEARRQFQTVLAADRPISQLVEITRYGLGLRTTCLGRLGNVRWFLGDPDAATRARDSAIGLARETGHPHTLHTALIFGALLALELHDHELLRRYVSELLSDDDERTEPARQAAETFGALVDVLDGRGTSGVIRLLRTDHESTDRPPAPGARAFRMRVLLAACALDGDRRTGLEVADRALRLGDGVRTWESEARRVRAEFLVERADGASEVVAELEGAIRVARRQGAPLLELRAATTLLRLRSRTGPATAARNSSRLVASLVDKLPHARDTIEVRAALAVLGDAEAGTGRER